jgi:hypothetical protein
MIWINRRRVDPSPLVQKQCLFKVGSRRNKRLDEVFMKNLAIFCVAFGVSGIASADGLSDQSLLLLPSRLHSGTGMANASGKSGNALQVGNANAPASDTAAISSPPTRGSFMATWNDVKGANGYLLDVSTSDSFSSFVEGYQGLDVGKVAGRAVTGLHPGTTYYYRVRAYAAAGPGGYSNAMKVTTAPATGLTIQATFDSSITGAPNAAVIEASINRAISVYESVFTDPITVQIRFRYAQALPDGTPLSHIVESLTVIYGVGWNVWTAALRADAKSSNDSLANATLPATPIIPSLVASSPNGRALGQNTPPAMNADGTVSVGGAYDGIVTLNSGISVQFTRPTDPNRFDAQRSFEQGIGSIMGLLYSLTDFMPIDLFSWAAPNSRNFDVSGRRYFSIDGGVTTIIDYNQSPNFDFASWLSPQCPQAHPFVQNSFPCAGQSADISATSPEGINLDVIGYDITQPQSGPPRLGNLSTRSFVQLGDNVMIGGFIVQGTGPKRVIIRAIGPELAPFGVPNPLANPTLELHDGTGSRIASNNDWQTTIIGGIITGNQVTDIQNSGHAPASASESAIIADLQPGNYTAILSGVNGTTGVALVEVYDLAPDATASLGNVSTRSFVQTADNVMIGGFIVQGTGPKRVIVRAIGPELSQFGVPNPLANPILELHDGTGAVVGTNDDWQTTIIGGIITASQVTDIQNSGHAPTAPSESAIIATLQPGNYTAIVRGVNNTTGVALVEVYDLH